MRVNITVWKSLWKMLKTFDTSRKIRGDSPLWEILRKNISDEKGGKNTLFGGWGRNLTGYLQDLPWVCYDKEE